MITLQKNGEIIRNFGFENEKCDLQEVVMKQEFGNEKKHPYKILKELKEENEGELNGRRFSHH